MKNASFDAFAALLADIGNALMRAGRYVARAMATMSWPALLVSCVALALAITILPLALFLFVIFLMARMVVIACASRKRRGPATPYRPVGRRRRMKVRARNLNRFVDLLREMVEEAAAVWWRFFDWLAMVEWRQLAIIAFLVFAFGVDARLSGAGDLVRVHLVRRQGAGRRQAQGRTAGEGSDHAGRRRNARAAPDGSADGGAAGAGRAALPVQHTRPDRPADRNRSAPGRAHPRQPDRIPALHPAADALARRRHAAATRSSWRAPT